MGKTITVSPEVKQKLIHWHDADFLDGISVLKGSFPGRLFGTFGHHAITINGMVRMTSNRTNGPYYWATSASMLIKQQQMGWWRFLARYIAGWRPSHIKHRSRHPLEALAYVRGREILRALR